jgi:hypothetical protein
VLNDATDVLAHIRGGDGYGQCLNPITWSFTVDGDNVLDQAEDSTRHIYAVVGGVPGDLPAYTRIDATLGLTNSVRAIFLANIVCDLYKWISPVNQYFFDRNGTGTSSADSGSAATTTYIDVAPDNATIALTPARQDLMPTRETALIGRLSDAGTYLTVSVEDAPGGSSTLAKTLAANATRRIFYLGSVNTDSTQRHQIRPTESYNIVLGATIARTGSAGNVVTDFFLVIPGTLVKLYTGYDLESTYIVRLEDGVGTYFNNSSLAIYDMNATGNIELEPNKLNTIMWISGDQGDAHTVTDTATLAIYVTPRWSIL